MRTFANLAKRYKQFIASGGKLKDASKYANIINPPLVEEEPSKRVIDVWPIPELHILMGVVLLHMNLLISMFGFDYVDNWCKSHGILRNGFQARIDQVWALHW